MCCIGFFYHRVCLVDHERKCKKNENQPKNAGKYISDVEIINELRFTLESGQITNVNEVNEEYIRLFAEYEADAGNRDK